MLSSCLSVSRDEKKKQFSFLASRDRTRQTETTVDQTPIVVQYWYEVQKPTSPAGNGGMSALNAPFFITSLFFFARLGGEWWVRGCFFFSHPPSIPSSPTTRKRVSRNERKHEDPSICFTVYFASDAYMCALELSLIGKLAPYGFGFGSV